MSWWGESRLLTQFWHWKLCLLSSTSVDLAPFESYFYSKKAVQWFKGVAIKPKIFANDLIEAETYWTRIALSMIEEQDFTLWYGQLQLFKDKEQVWRCGGRIENADVSFSVKHPAILTRQHHFTQLVIKDAHERVFHNGIKETLTEVRSWFWIVKGRQLVRRLLYHCTICKRYEGKPFSAPLPPQLPEFRVTEKPPFTVVGVDFAGPLYFKTQGEQVTSQKVWVCLFTCCVVRAVHLELVLEMSAQAFIQALKRFVSREDYHPNLYQTTAKPSNPRQKLLLLSLNTPLHNTTLQQSG